MHCNDVKSERNPFLTVLSYHKACLSLVLHGWLLVLPIGRRISSAKAPSPLIMSRRLIIGISPNISIDEVNSAQQHTSSAWLILSCLKRNTVKWGLHLACRFSHHPSAADKTRLQFSDVGVERTSAKPVEIRRKISGLKESRSFELKASWQTYRVKENRIEYHIGLEPRIC